MTPLKFAICDDRVDLVQLCLDRGADDDLGDALVMACGRGNVVLATLFLDSGADADHRAQGGVWHTALSTSCQNGHVGVATLLIERGASRANARREKRSELRHMLGPAQRPGGPRGSRLADRSFDRSFGPE